MGRDPMTRARTIAAALVAALLLGAAPARADDPLARAEEGMRQILTALQLLIASIPQYEMPEVLDNGDIIIRRVQPEAPLDPGDANGDGIEETMI